MTCLVEWDDRAVKELKRIDREAQRDILQYMRERVASDEDPRRFGKQLLGDKWGLWRYRVGDFRIICSIEEGRLVVLVIKVTHRRKVYR